MPRRWVASLAAVLACLAPVRAQDDAPIRVDVKLVTVFTSVLDARGAPVPGLTKADFRVAEDGVPQTIAVFARDAGMPLQVVMAIDASLSTRRDLKMEETAAKRFMHAILRPQDAAAVFQFAEDVDQLVPFTADLKRIDAGIDRIHTGSATALYDAVYLGSDALLDHRPKQPSRNVMVLVTDGGDTMSKTDYKEAARRALESETMVYSIIVVPIEASAGRNTGGEHALIQLSTDTGGRYYYAAGSDQLDKVFARVADDLRTQYLLGYYPVHRLAESDFRRIEVALAPSIAAGHHYQIRHRLGYYTSKPK